MLSVSYAGKNAYSAGKTSGVLRGGASGANRCYVLAHCAPPPPFKASSVSAFGSAPPQTDIANYGVFCIENMLFHYLTFHITGLPNFWRKNNLKFFGEPPLQAP